MAKQVIYRRGTTAEHANFVGANGEITVDTVKHVVIVHDGVTAGGFPLANASTITANISALTANAANQASAITVLQANAATQSANIATLFANAAAQQANITAFTLASNSTVIFADIDGVRANVTAANVQIGLLYGNATIQSEAIVLANANIIALQSSITAANAAIAGIVTGTTFVTQTAFANNLTAVNSAISTQGTTFATNVAVAGVTANVTAANVEISALQANIAAANVAINNIALSPSLVNSIAQAVGPIVTAGSFYSNSNLAGYLSSQNITSANASINTINANVTAANTAIQSLSANIGTLVAGAPGALDTLIELGNALGNNASFSATMVTWLSNITSNITAANGSITTLQTQVYANANVATYLPTYTGNIAGNIVKSGYTWTFSNTGTTTFPTGVTLSNARGANTVNFTTAIDKSFQIETQTNATSKLWNFTTDGNLTLPQNANINFSNGVSILSGIAGAYGNTQVATYLPTYTGNITAGNLTITGNLVIAGNTSVFGTDSALIQPSNNLPLLAISSGANGAVSSVWVEDIGNVGTSNIAAVYANPTVGSGIVRIAVGQNGGNAGPNLWDFGTDGNLTLPGNTFAVNYANGTQVSLGGGNVTWAQLEDKDGNSGPTLIALGQNAGLNGQGVNAVAIGAYAGESNQGNNSIIINATGVNLDQTTDNTFTVAPVRNDVANTAQVMFYNATSKEVTYGNTISVAGNITAGNVSAVNFVGAIQAQVGSSFAYSLNAFGAGSDTGGVFLPADINSNAVVAGYTIVSSAGVTLTVTSASFIAGTPNFVTVATTPTASSFLYPATVYSNNYSPALPTSTITVGNATVSGNITAGGNITQQSAYYETYSNVTNSGGNLTCNFVNGGTFYATLTANVTVNFTNVVATAGRVTGATLIVDQGATAYRVANLQINSGGIQTIKYAGGTPNTGTASNTDVMSFSLISLNGTNWRVLGQISNYG